MALELAVLRLRRLGEEPCLQSLVARADRQPQPEPHAFIQRVVSSGFRLPSFTAVHNYLSISRKNNSLPDSEDLLNVLLPWSRRYPVPKFWQG